MNRSEPIWFTLVAAAYVPSAPWKHVRTVPVVSTAIAPQSETPPWSQGNG